MLDTAACAGNYTRLRPSAKLKSKRMRPFEILELVGKNAIRLELPPSMRIHPVVNMWHTSPYYEQPAEISNTPMLEYPQPTSTSLGDEYDVERILRHLKIGNSHQFLVQWKGYPTTEASWEPTRNFSYDDGTIHASLSD